MPRKPKRGRSTSTDKDQVPRLPPSFFAHAEIVEGGRVVRAGTKVLVNDRRGRPRLANPKQAVKLRIDHDVLEHFRASGPGWQSRMNAALRKAAGLSSPGK